MKNMFHKASFLSFTAPLVMCAALAMPAQAAQPAAPTVMSSEKSDAPVSGNRMLEIAGGVVIGVLGLRLLFGGSRSVGNPLAGRLGPGEGRPDGDPVYAGPSSEMN